MEDEELAKEVLQVLSSADLSITLKVLIATLEAKLECNLSEKKPVIKATLASFVESRMKEIEQDEECEEEVAVVQDNQRNTALKKKGRGGFQKPLCLSPELASFLGESFLPRTEVVKRLWVYIKENRLQCPKDGRVILFDEKLQKVFKKTKINMFKMQAELAKMLMSRDDLTPQSQAELERKEEDGEGTSESEGESDEDDSDVEEGRVKKRIRPVDPVEESSHRKSARSVHSKSKIETKTKSKGSKGSKGAAGGASTTSTSGFNRKVPLSEALAGFLGTREESRPQVVSKIWQHVKAHNLQNPKDKREIILDAPLKEIFGVSKVTAFSLNKHLSPHFVKST